MICKLKTIYQLLGSKQVLVEMVAIEQNLLMIFVVHKMPPIYQHKDHNYLITLSITLFIIAIKIVFKYCTNRIIHKNFLYLFLFWEKFIAN